MSGPVGRAYAELVNAGELKPDPAQERAVAALDRLAESLKSERGGLLGKLFNDRQSGPSGVLSLGRCWARQVDADGPRLRPHRRSARSAGSTSTPSCSKPTRACASTGKDEEGDPLERVADDIADEARLLCFDEMHGQQPRRCDDPVATVRAVCSNAGCGWSRRRTARRAISTRTASTASCSCRSSSSSSSASTSSKSMGRPTIACTACQA